MKITIDGENDEAMWLARRNIQKAMNYTWKDDPKDEAVWMWQFVIGKQIGTQYEMEYVRHRV